MAESAIKERVSPHWHTASSGRLAAPKCSCRVAAKSSDAKGRAIFQGLRYSNAHIPSARRLGIPVQNQCF
jgi:hypothetical protein